MTENNGPMKDVQGYLAANAERFVDELKDFLRIASVSADPAFKKDIERGAEFVRSQLASAGIEAEIVPTGGHPIVYGCWLNAPGAPTVLVYGHYDVQPPDPLNEWISPPFDPQVRDGFVFARGATDDKGQMLTHVKSAEAWLKTVGRLPVNLKFVIEGEEEVGSNNLDRFLEASREKLKCDVAVISDTSQYAPGMPAITYGLRGITACEVMLRGPSRDLHSGVFGGAVTNPAVALSRMVAALHDEKGRVQVPGFYDDVLPLSDKERKALAALPADEAAFCKELGVDAGWGEAGFTSLERRWCRPTCDVNGVISGYTGEGPKTIVPASARVKISCRLVPNQDADKIAAAIRKFFELRLPPGVRMDFKTYHGCPAVLVDTHSPYMAAAREAIESAFGVAPVMIREGGSIPVVATFRQVLGVDTLLLGWGQNTDNLHAPNERFNLADFHRGAAASAYLWHALAR